MSFLAFFMLSTFVSTSSIIYGQMSSESPQDQNRDYAIDSLFVALLSNGDASIDFNLVVSSNKSSSNVTLFGGTIQNLTLTDYNETAIKYSPSEISNKFTVYSPASTDIHVTYTTPDLVDKQNRNWTFSLYFPDKFLLKLPSQAHIIDMEPPAFLTPTGEQNLWGFGPGNVQVSYIIGPLGTREEAQASLKSLEDAVSETKLNYDGIVLSNATFSLENARSAFKQGQYLETLTHSANTINLLQNTSQKYISAKNAISQAAHELQVNNNNGFDISEANQTLALAQNLFLTGGYEGAENGARQAISQSNLKAVTFVETANNNLILILGIILGVITAIIVILIMRKRKNFLKTTIEQKSEDLSSAQPISSMADNQNISSSDDPPESDTKVHNLSPIHLNSPTDSPTDGDEIKDYLQKVVEEVGNVRKNQEQKNKSALHSFYSGNQLSDKQWMTQIVNQIKLERPHLREDDKNLLDYLCEKEGTAFESEIRNKFILPRTSLWRLIKRLEREELLEVRKIGGQNLIKLRLEDKSF
jgi:uncharacterized membrane protein